MRAELAGLEDRHGGADAEGARHIAAGQHDAALAAADDHRLVGERRVVALLDGGVERVAVDMRDREREQTLVAQQARGAARRAARGRFRHVLPAVAAEAVRSRIGVGLAQHASHGMAPRHYALWGYRRMDNITKKIAAYASSLSFNNLDEATRHAATQRLIDALGCGLGRARLRASADRPAPVGRRDARQICRPRAVLRRPAAGGIGRLHQHHDDPQFRFQRPLSGRASERRARSADRARERDERRRQALPRRDERDVRDLRAAVGFDAAQPPRLGPGICHQHFGGRRRLQSARAAVADDRQRDRHRGVVERAAARHPLGRADAVEERRHRLCRAQRPVRRVPRRRRHGGAGPCLRGAGGAVRERHRAVHAGRFPDRRRAVADAARAAEILAGRDQRPAGDLGGARPAQVAEGVRHHGDRRVRQQVHLVRDRQRAGEMGSADARDRGPQPAVHLRPRVRGRPDHHAARSPRTRCAIPRSGR